MKKIIAFAAAGIMLAGCQNEELTQNNGAVPSMEDQAISFSANDVKATRGESIEGAKAAKLLGNNFIVYGFKLSKDELPDGSSDQKVFDLYNVNYADGTANLTESNSNNWEYVGYTPATGSDASQQTVKYWDYAAKGYVFSAVSGLDITASKIASAQTIYEKGWNVTIPAGGSLAGLYASERVPVVNEWTENNQTFRYTNPVGLKFYSLASKVRFAIYETVPGYSVKIDRFYYSYDNAAGYRYSATNFVLDGTFKMLDNTSPSKALVTYYSDADELQGIGIKNHPKVDWNEGYDTKTALTFGANLQAQSQLGTTTATATYDQADGSYTYILPYKQADNKLSLKVDFTLTATDGSDEKIYVHGATATVPANYTQWKENFAYTYIFKITDKVNGSTIPYDPGDDPENPKPDPYNPYNPGPENPNPEGLSPITFDACVVTEEEGVQETVTTFGEPAINTYQKGAVVTVNDEYIAGESIYFSATQSKALMDLSTDANVYEVYNFTDSPITEGLVANYATNKVVLIPVAKTEALTVPLEDNSYLTFSAKNCYQFMPQTGKTYAIQIKYNTTKYAYKIVKIAGTAAEPTYSLTVASGSEIKTSASKANLELKVGETKVAGAKANLSIFNSANEDVTANFAITETDASTYDVQLTDAAIQAGADGTYTVKFANDKANAKFKVDLHYVLRLTNGGSQLPSNTLDVIAGKNNSFKLTIGMPGSLEPVTKAVISNTNKGIEIGEVDGTPGTYKVSVAADVATGNYTATIAGQTLNIAVTSYSFSTEGKFTLVWEEDGEAPTKDITLSPCESTEDVTITSSNTEVVDNATTNKSKNGVFTIEAKDGGKTTLSFENAKQEVTVNKYELVTDATRNAKEISKATGSATLTLKCNGNVISASASKVIVTKWNGSEYQTITTGFSLITSGQNIVFGNVSAKGKYMFYYVDASISSNAIGNEIIRVSDN